VDGVKAIIHLENLSRDFVRDRDAARITGFVDAILAGTQTPEWEAARPRIRWALEPAGMPLKDILHDWVSDQVARSRLGG
jgi:hypothetical protein